MLTVGAEADPVPLIPTFLSLASIFARHDRFLNSILAH